MQRHVYLSQIHSVDELKRRLIDVWCGLEQSIFDETIDQWRGRHRACVHAKGRHFEYIPGTYQVRPHLIRKVGADEASYGSANSQSVKKPIDARRAFSRPDLNELSVSESITC